MHKAALALSVVALALSGWLVWNASSSAARVDRLCRDLEGLAALEARVATLEGVPPAGPAAPRPAEALSAPPPATAADVAAGATDAGTTAGSGRPASVPGRVADLEKRLAALESSAKDVHEIAMAPAFASGRARFLPAGGRAVYGSVEDAKSDLDLTDQQKGDFERILADARREAEDLRKVPDDEGKTWEQVQRETFTNEGGAFRFDMSKLEGFRKKTVPGRSETFGQADQRIREGAKRRLRDTLSTAQQEKFDKAAVDPMLGGGGSAAFVSIVTQDAIGLPGK